MQNLKKLDEVIIMGSKMKKKAKRINRIAAEIGSVCGFSRNELGDLLKVTCKYNEIQEKILAKGSDFLTRDYLFKKYLSNEEAFTDVFVRDALLHIKNSWDDGLDVFEEGVIDKDDKPIYAKVLQLAIRYTALTNSRVDRKAYCPTEAIHRLESDAEGYDPYILDAMSAIVQVRPSRLA